MPAGCDEAQQWVEHETCVDTRVLCCAVCAGRAVVAHAQAGESGQRRCLSVSAIFQYFLRRALCMHIMHQGAAEPVQ